MADDLEIKIIDIKGTCPVYNKCDKFIIAEGYKLQSNKEICMHSLSSILPYYNALARGIKAEELGLASENDYTKAYLQCLDPCKITGGGTVLMQISIKK